MNKILLIGAGQIGSRHLQALEKSQVSAKIFVVDPNQSALGLSKKRLAEVVLENNDPKMVSFAVDFSGVPPDIDLAIIATPADSRLEITKFLIKAFKVKYWILEKILVQRSADLEYLRCLFIQQHKVWVNMPRRSVKWFQSIHAAIQSTRPLSISVDSHNLGLACNAVHFIDLAMWFVNQNTIKLEASNLSPSWHKAKRQGFWEVEGTISGLFECGSTISISDHVAVGKPTDYKITINENGYQWTIDEEKGLAKRADGFSIAGEMPLQSDMTGDIVNQILIHGECCLPQLGVAIQSHKPLLDLLECHWALHGEDNIARVPIT